MRSLRLPKSRVRKLSTDDSLPENSKADSYLQQCAAAPGRYSTDRPERTVLVSEAGTGSRVWGPARASASHKNAEAPRKGGASGRKWSGLLRTPDEAQRVDLSAVLEHFEMHVRAGRAAGGTHVRQRIAARHGVAHADSDAFVMAVAGHQSIAMADFDEV